MPTDPVTGLTDDASTVLALLAQQRVTGSDGRDHALVAELPFCLRLPRPDGARDPRDGTIETDATYRAFVTAHEASLAAAAAGRVRPLAATHSIGAAEAVPAAATAAAAAAPLSAVARFVLDRARAVTSAPRPPRGGPTLDEGRGSGMSQVTGGRGSSGLASATASGGDRGGSRGVPSKPARTEMDRTSVAAAASRPAPHSQQVQPGGKLTSTAAGDDRAPLAPREKAQKGAPPTSPVLTSGRRTDPPSASASPSSAPRRDAAAAVWAKVGTGLASNNNSGSGSSEPLSRSGAAPQAVSAVRAATTVAASPAESTSTSTVQLQPSHGKSSPLTPTPPAQQQQRQPRGRGGRASAQDTTASSSPVDAGPSRPSPGDSESPRTGAPGREVRGQPTDSGAPGREVRGQPTDSGAPSRAAPRSTPPAASAAARRGGAGGAATAAPRAREDPAARRTPPATPNSAVTSSSTRAPTTSSEPAPPSPTAAETAPTVAATAARPPARRQGGGRHRDAIAPPVAHSLISDASPSRAPSQHVGPARQQAHGGGPAPAGAVEAPREPLRAAPGVGRGGTGSARAVEGSATEAADPAVHVDPSVKAPPKTQGRRATGRRSGHAGGDGDNNGGKASSQQS